MFGFKSEKDMLIESYETIIDRKNKEIAELTKARDAELSTADFEIDFELLNPFSIERYMDNGKPLTSLGYFNSKGDTREWLLCCSLATHQRLAADFREFLFNKYYEE